jgi:hypothetical protein
MRKIYLFLALLTLIALACGTTTTVTPPTADVNSIVV